MKAEKHTLYHQEVQDCRKAKRERKRSVKDLQARGLAIPNELLVSIVDREKKTRVVEEEREKQAHNYVDDDIEILLNAGEDYSLCWLRNTERIRTPDQNFLLFPSSPPEGEWLHRDLSRECSLASNDGHSEIQS